MIDEDRKNGTIDKVKGAVKEGIGKLTGNEEREAEGKVQKNKGKVQNKFGEAKDDVRDETDH